MHILIHRKTLKDMINVSKDLQDVLAPVFKENMVIRHKGTVLDIGDRIASRVRVDFRCGSKDKLAGLRPDFYNSDSSEVIDYLSCTSHDGVWLNGIDDVHDVIVGHFRGRRAKLGVDNHSLSEEEKIAFIELCKEDPVLFIEKFLNITMLEYQKVYVREVFKKLSEKQIKEE